MRRLAIEDREFKVGIEGRAEVGGCEALKARGGRGNAVVVMVMVLWEI